MIALSALVLKKQKKLRHLHLKPISVLGRGQIKISSREISGMNGYFNDNYHSFAVRRRGPRVIVVGEPTPSKEQVLALFVSFKDWG